MKMKTFLIPIASLLLLAACEKEIDINFHTVSPLYAAEVLLTPDDITAHVMTTHDVTESNSGSAVVDAVVTIRTKGINWTDTLENIGKGRYQLPYYAEEGKEYEVDVYVDGRHHTSTSVMHSMPQVNNFRFVWQDVVSERMLLADLRLQDSADENNYYFVHLYRNGVGYRWAVTDDMGCPGGELQMLFTCCTQRDMEKDEGNDILREGDVVRIEVRSIDVRTYDYLCSVEQMDQTGTNPIANFSGGMLGYFSAFQEHKFNVVFHSADVENQ